MIFGNPNSFAVLIDKVDAWKYPDYPEWTEGVFDFIFNNIYLSEKIISYTFNELFYDAENIYFLKMPYENKDFFYAPKEYAFEEMLNAWNPYILNENPVLDQWDQTDKYLLNPLEMNAWVTMVSYQNQVRILGAMTDSLIPIPEKGNEWMRRNSFFIHEAIITLDEYIQIKEKIIQYLKELY